MMLIQEKFLMFLLTIKVLEERIILYFYEEIGKFTGKW